MRSSVELGQSKFLVFFQLRMNRDAASRSALLAQLVLLLDSRSDVGQVDRNFVLLALLAEHDRFDSLPQAQKRPPVPSSILTYRQSLHTASTFLTETPLNRTNSAGLFVSGHFPGNSGAFPSDTLSAPLSPMTLTCSTPSHRRQILSCPISLLGPLFLPVSHMKLSMKNRSMVDPQDQYRSIPIDPQEQVKGTIRPQIAAMGI
jgi:hypothetical protein